MTRVLSPVASVCATFAFAAMAMASDYPTKVFDASYEVSQPTGTAQMRMLSDGKGHMRTETATGGSKVDMIADYVKKQSLTLMPVQKMAFKGKLAEDSYQGNEESDMKKKHAKDLGTKVVAGHPCHGWEYTSTTTPHYVTQVWLGNDIGWFVESTSTLPNGKSTTTLRSFSTKAPDATLFSMEVPAGYKASGTY